MQHNYTTTQSQYDDGPVDDHGKDHTRYIAGHVYWSKTIETSPYDVRDEFNINIQPPGKLMKEGKLFQISGGMLAAV